MNIHEFRSDYNNENEEDPEVLFVGAKDSFQKTRKVFNPFDVDGSVYNAFGHTPNESLKSENNNRSELPIVRSDLSNSYLGVKDIDKYMNIGSSSNAKKTQLQMHKYQYQFADDFVNEIEEELSDEDYIPVVNGNHLHFI